MATYLIDCLRHSPLVLLMEKSDAHSVKIRVDKGLWQVSTLVPDHVQPQILNLNHKKITYFIVSIQGPCTVARAWTMLRCYG